MYLALFAGAAPMLLGAGALVEMLYHQRLDAMLGPSLVFMGFNLNTNGLTSWSISLFLCLIGAGLLEAARRRFVKSWELIQAEIERMPSQEAE
jgi:branched-chain amino acid transport system permease protein